MRRSYQGRSRLEDTGDRDGDGLNLERRKIGHKCS